MKRLVLTLVLLSVPALVRAQVPTVVPPITAVRLVISGGVAPVTNDLPVANLTSLTGAACTASATPVANPTAFTYKVNTSDTTCWKYQDPGNGPLLSLPIGGTTYTATLAYVNANGAGPTVASTNSFTRPGVSPSTAPAVLTVVP